MKFFINGAISSDIIEDIHIIRIYSRPAYNSDEVVTLSDSKMLTSYSTS